MASYAHSPEPATGSLEAPVDELKRPKTAWGLFLEAYKKTRGKTGGIGRFNELQKEASSIWKGMSPEEKSPWIEREKISNDEYVQRRLELGSAGPATPGKRKRSSAESKGYRRAFQFFVNEHRQQNPLYWSLFTFNQAQRELSAAWNAIPMAEKQKWFMLETAQNAKPAGDREVSQPVNGSYTDDGFSSHYNGFSDVSANAGMVSRDMSTGLSSHLEPFQGGQYFGDVGSYDFSGAAQHGRTEIDQDSLMQGYQNALSSSRSFSDGDLQVYEKKRKYDSKDERCDTTYSDSALSTASPRGLQTFSGFNPSGIDQEEFFNASNEGDGHTFDIVTNSTFLDPDSIFSA